MTASVKPTKPKQSELSKAAAIMASKNASPEERKRAAAILGKAGGKYSLNKDNNSLPEKVDDSD